MPRGTPRSKESQYRVHSLLRAGYSHREVSMAIGIPMGTIATWVRRKKKQATWDTPMTWEIVSPKKRSG